MLNNDLRYKIGLSLIPKVGHITAKKLVSYVGSYEGIFKESKNSLMKVPGIGEIMAKSIISANALHKADEEIEFIQKKNIQVLFYLDKEYPERLKNCEDAPILIYALGETDLNARKVLSIVGTRKATPDGVDFCEKLVKELKEHGHNPLIVSGLAYGIDIVAHKTALDCDLQTVAVFGHGLDIVYPASHKKVAGQIINQGMLITDFPSKSIRDKNNFIKRNRIIAGMADATIVVESGDKGGALVTADIANSYNRDVFAVPGRINDVYSRGCNNLIKTNRAAMLTGIEDLEYILGWENTAPKDAFQKELFVELNDEEKNITEILQKFGELSIDMLCVKANQPTSKVSPVLLDLEFKGMVRSLPGKVYKLI